MDNEGGISNRSRHDGGTPTETPREFGVHNRDVSRSQAESQRELRQYVEDARRHDEAEAAGQHMMSKEEVYKSEAEAQAAFLAKQHAYDEADRAKAQAWRNERDRALDESAAIARVEKQREQLLAEHEERQRQAEIKRGQREQKPLFRLPSKEQVASFFKGLFGIRKAA